MCRIIFIYLTAASIPLGIFPHRELITLFDLDPEFGTLTQAIKLGDISSYKNALENGRAWYAKRGIYLLLREKGEVLVWRSLIRRTYAADIFRNNSDSNLTIAFRSC